MAITDTYNGDLVRTRVYCPEEKSNFETEITQVQEDEFALMNIEIEKMGQAAAKDASYVNDALKIIEAKRTAARFNIIYDKSEDGQKRAKADYEEAKNEFREWLDEKWGPQGEAADDYMIHQKVSRQAHVNASEFNDDRDII